MTERSRSAALSRRGFVSLGVGALAVGALPFAAWRRRQLVRRSMPVMGTVADLLVVSSSVAVARDAIDAALAELRRVETLMTRFDATSDVGRFNRAAPGEAIRVAPETALVVAEALQWAEATGGTYDPAIAGMIQLWDVTHRETPPSPDLVARFAGRAFHREVEVGRFGGAPALVRHSVDASLDLGGIAKGYGVDRAIAALREWGIANAIVDVGGDLYALGAGMDGDGWRVGIQSPWSRDGIVRVLRVADAAIATSGTYAQYFTHQGRRYHHLMDPATGAPRATAVQSFTVQADSCMRADVAATACYGAPDAARILARRAPGATVVSTI